MQEYKEKEEKIEKEEKQEQKEREEILKEHETEEKKELDKKIEYKSEVNADDLVTKKSLTKVSLSSTYKLSEELIHTLARVGWWNGMWEP